MPVFLTQGEFVRFVNLIEYYQFSNTPMSFSYFKNLPAEERNKISARLKEKLELHVEVLAFCLMDNHYHFLIKQISANGTSRFISNLQNGYAKYFNIKTDRSGPLFQPMFKSVRIETDEQLLHVSRYIHLNPSTGYLVSIKNLINYHWSSLPCYIEDNFTQFPFVNSEIILGLIKDKKKYKEFVFDQADYQRQLDNIKHLTHE